MILIDRIPRKGDDARRREGYLVPSRWFINPSMVAFVEHDKGYHPTDLPGVEGPVNCLQVWFLAGGDNPLSVRLYGAEVVAFMEAVRPYMKSPAAK